ncbi:unnamed protein product [Adineta ricciae]|uniref:Uncharacterized protein n=1 Tax=Adineta ricciae TaxID=249248 RepID=A0A815IV91_ADIRI|nr:unnamed protein product [Adineta ricciae]CAF1437025.1 unnamed protein product [Adineta ricciae]
MLTNITYCPGRAHRRLDRVLYPSIFTNTLTLLEKFSPPDICSLSSLVLDRFCSQVLPAIEHNIQWMNLEGSSLERVLSSGNFLHLSGLGVYGITKTYALHLLSDETLLCHQLRKQISSLAVQTTGDVGYRFDLNELIFKNLIHMFSNLKSLDLNPFKVYHQITTMSKTHLSVYSSTLRESSIQLRWIDDCLYILDGRFDQLCVFNVKVMYSSRSRSLLDFGQVNPSNLRSLSFTNLFEIDCYDEFLVPLLHRM